MQRSGKLREDADSLTNATKARAGEVKRVSLLEGERTESDRAEERLVRGRWYFNEPGCLARVVFAWPRANTCAWREQRTPFTAS